MWNEIKRWCAQWNPVENVVVLGILLFLAVLLFRWLILRSGVLSLKRLGLECYREVRRLYAVRSLLGWACFALAVSLVEVWILYPWVLPRFATGPRVVGVTSALFLLGAFFHLEAFLKALARYLEIRMNGEGRL